MLTSGQEYNSFTIHHLQQIRKFFCTIWLFFQIIFLIFGFNALYYRSRDGRARQWRVSGTFRPGSLKTELHSGEKKMDLWLETIGAVSAAILGGVFGRMFSRLQKPYWLLGYISALLAIAISVIARYNIRLSFLPPFCWVATGQVKFIILLLAITMGLTTPLSRLPRKCEKWVTAVCMAGFVAYFSVSLFLAPALLKNDLSNLQTRIDPDGICLQSRGYTCGPAAAVTALRKLGFQAHEGQIAVLSHTSPLTGTLPQRLYTALQEHWGNQGLKCRFRYFDSIGQLKGAGITLAVIRDAFLLDHCVAVLEVSDRTVVIADPVYGRQRMSHKQFEKIWRFRGIVLKRDSTQNI